MAGGFLIEQTDMFHIPLTLLAALATLSSALTLVVKTIPRSSVVGTFGIVGMLGGLWEGRV